MNLPEIAVCARIVIDGNGVTSLVGEHFHGWYIGVPIAQKNHPLKRYGTIRLCFIGIYRFIIPMIIDAFIDSEEILRLGRVVDCDAGPSGEPVTVYEFLFEYTLEMLRDSAPFNHLFYAGRDDEMFQLESQASSMLVHAFEPRAIR